MQRELIRRELVRLDMEASDQDSFFAQEVDELLLLGYVKPSYLDALRTREAAYPTALPTSPEAIAIPHADMQHIVRPFIAPVRLAAPVDWHEMGNDDVIHPVRFIFLLGFTKADGHVELLQILLDNFQDPTFIPSLAEAKNVEELYSIVHGMNGLED